MSAKHNWKKITDKRVKHRWIATCRCQNILRVALVNPDYYETNGTPTCGNCGAEYRYLHTQVNIPDTAPVSLNTPPPGYDYWDTHPDHTLNDWQYACDNNDTRMGYWEWVAEKLADAADLQRHNVPREGA